MAGNCAPENAACFFFLNGVNHFKNEIKKKIRHLRCIVPLYTDLHRKAFLIPL